ncbi:RluA family pseudouridine synthase [Falsibacillus pallidus]|uniref:Pseudouridine synthase n=1 Tax=Falsibacillus pallidus TaxID=493781 RepID=A0A370GW34_9BACI|nr:RluA family pseudouridine synthase [Falsibacillus pallidus]RDI47751.1 ribosomal large subunit pseudouridine synthase D [Falsibacillus pallidus]
MNSFVLTWEIDDAGKEMSIKDFLAAREISKRALTDIKFSGGRIEVNGQVVNVRYLLKTGDKLTVLFPPEIPSSGLLGQDIPLDIVYEDDHVLVINKPPGMNTIPSRDRPDGSIANAVLGLYNKKMIGATIHIVTRLDRDTSGLLLIAKNRYCHHLLSKQQKTNQLTRTYLAVAEGNISPEKGVIDAPIGRKPTSIIEREVNEQGKKAVTHYEVIRSQPSHSLVELKLETGRTHQIRVHMSYIGHPLAGDDLYGGSTEHIKRQALHCVKLEFYHPIQDEKLIFTADLPKDMEQLAKADF